MAEIPFSWSLDCSLVNSDLNRFPYEQTKMNIKVSKFDLTTVLETTWTLQLQPSEVHFNSFYGPEEKVVLRLERDHCERKVHVEGTVGVFDMTYYRRLAILKFKYVLDPGERTIPLTLDFPMCDLSKAMFDDVEIRVQGNITVFLSPATEGESCDVKYIPLQELSSDMESLLKDGHFSDVTIKCDTVVLHAHKGILCSRSPVFAAMFRSPMKEAQENEVTITDVEPVVVQKLVTFVYSGQVADMTTDLAMSLMHAGSKYQISGLITICAQYLKSHISLDNGLKILRIADLFDQDLRQQAMDYVSTRFSHFKNTNEWSSLTEELPKLKIETLERVIQLLHED